MGVNNSTLHFSNRNVNMLNTPTYKTHTVVEHLYV